MSQYFPRPYEPFSRDTNVKVDLSNYAIETDIKNISHVDTFKFFNLLIHVDTAKIKFSRSKN